MVLTGEKAVRSWLMTGAFFILLMVVIGGITRLTGSGLSMAHWSVTGSIPPMDDESWQIHFDSYKESPQFKKVNMHFTLNEFKSIFWWEFIHRMTGRFMGLLFFIPFLFFLYKGWLKGRVLKKVLLLFCVGSFQGVLGWFMVKSGLVDKPHVDHFRLAAHLVTALAAFVLCIDIILETMRTATRRHKFFRSASGLLLLLLLIQIIYGAFVSGLKAGYVFNTFPMMNGEIMPYDVIRLTPLYANIFENGTAVQFIHRWNGVFILLLSSLMAYFSANDTSGNRKTAARMVVILTLIQFSLGLITLIFHVPLVAAVFHQACAFLLFGTCYMVYKLSR